MRIFRNTIGNIADVLGRDCVCGGLMRGRMTVLICSFYSYTIRIYTIFHKKGAIKIGNNFVCCSLGKSLV